MEVKVASTCFQWSSPPSPSSPSSSSTSLIPLSPRGRRRSISDRPSHLIRRSHMSPFLGSGKQKLAKSKSLENLSLSLILEVGRRKPAQSHKSTLKRAISASSDSSFGGGGDSCDEDEFVRKIEELTARFQDVGGGSSSADLLESHGEDYEEHSTSDWQHHESSSSSYYYFPSYSPFESTATRIHDPLPDESSRPPLPCIRPEPFDWDNQQQQNIEMTASSVELPLSLRILKKKKQWEQGARGLTTAYCSVKKAFSSMVFIVRELQSYNLQLRELLFYEDLQGIVARVHKEMNASFCWLFQQIFSSTPTLMVSVMLLLANYTVYSMGNNVAVAAHLHQQLPVRSAVISFEDDCEQQQQQEKSRRFDGSSPSNSEVGGKSASLGGGGGGGRKVGPATDDGQSPFRRHRRTIITGGGGGDGGGGISSAAAGPSQEEQPEMVVSLEEEARAWKRILEEAARMQGETRHELVTDHETLARLVSPVTVEVESDLEYPEYRSTEAMYLTAVSQEPHNALLLSNYAQFLYQVAHDHVRAEYYFKRAVEVRPADAEALSRYANFLWVAKKDLTAAEETFLEAIAVEPGNTAYAANYAHFLWNTGGEGSCFPLDGPYEEEA